MTWKEGEIDGCVPVPFKKYGDDRGWLAEVFRHDELDESLHPTMGYLSLTHPGVARGPHEHADQTDLFVFFDGIFRVYLWDARKESPTYGVRYVADLGRERPATLIVPPGVVHAYRNVGTEDSLIFNCPNRLYAGWGKKEPVDEIRHEDEADSLYVMD